MYTTFASVKCKAVIHLANSYFHCATEFLLWTELKFALCRQDLQVTYLHLLGYCTPRRFGSVSLGITKSMITYHIFLYIHLQAARVETDACLRAVCQTQDVLIDDLYD